MEWVSLTIAILAIALWLRGSHHKRKRVKSERAVVFERNRAASAEQQIKHIKKINEVANERIKRDSRIDEISRGGRTDIGGDGVFDGTADTNGKTDM
jgi:hypothetical protein